MLFYSLDCTFELQVCKTLDLTSLSSVHGDERLTWSPRMHVSPVSSQFKLYSFVRENLVRGAIFVLALLARLGGIGNEGVGSLKYT